LSFVENIIRKEKPDFIFNFAAKSTASHDFIYENHDTISTGCLNILESVRKYSLASKIFISGSALQFENIGNPIDESTNFKATSSYAVSRIHSTYLSRYYREKFGMKIYIGYLFNHDSPLRNSNHFNKKVILEINEILSNNKSHINLGNLNIKKEFGFAGDIVEAIWVLVNQNKHFEAVIGTGKVFSLKEWVKKCFSKFDLDWEKFVIHDENDNIEYSVLQSNPNLIMNMGWSPKVDFNQLVDLMVDIQTIRDAV